jgi:hypothetical protein
MKHRKLADSLSRSSILSTFALAAFVHSPDLLNVLLAKALPLTEFPVIILEDSANEI